MNEENKFIYNDIAERYKRMNRFYVIASSIVWVMYAFYLALKLLNRNVPTTFCSLCLISCFVLLILNIIIYIKNKAGTKLKDIIVIEVVILFVLIGSIVDAEFLYFVLICIMIMQIPYYSSRKFKKFAILYAVAFSVVFLIRIKNGMGHNDVDGICKFLCTYLLIYATYKIGKIAQLFTDDALGSAEVQAKKQKEILDGVLSISQTVNTEADKSYDIVDSLVSATEEVASNMSDIARAANTTAHSIEEQNSMTQNIQDAIEETVSLSKSMVDIAVSSNSSINDNMNVMNSLTEQSKKIAETNHEVTEAMNRLQNKAK